MLGASCKVPTAWRASPTAMTRAVGSGFSGTGATALVFFAFVMPMLPTRIAFGCWMFTGR